MTSRSARPRPAERELPTEPQVRSSMPLRRVLAAVLVSCSVLLGVMTPSHVALAECGFPNRWPSFAEVAPLSDTVLVGTVTRIVSYWRHDLVGTFVVRVDDVLKGDAGARVRLSDVYTTGGCVVSWLVVRRGDRLAVALGGDSDVNGPVSAVAFLSPLPRYSDMSWAGMRRLTMAQVREAVGLPATDTAPSGAEGAAPPVPPAPALAALARAAVGLLSRILDGLLTSHRTSSGAGQARSDLSSVAWWAGGAARSPVERVGRVRSNHG